MLFTAAVVTQPVSNLRLESLDLILNAGIVGQLVMASLLLISVFSWAVLFTKYRSFKKASLESRAFLEAFWHSKDLEEVFGKVDKYKVSPVANVFKTGFRELKKVSEITTHNNFSDGLSNISRALTRGSIAEIAQLEKAIGFLASVASAAPFIGLFGTVWGIMHSFQSIGTTGSANLAVVAPGISEALITTAAGLAAAIPAVLGYNFFVSKIKVFASEIDAFSQDFLNIVERGALRGNEKISSKES